MTLTALVHDHVCLCVLHAGAVTKATPVTGGCGNTTPVPGISNKNVWEFSITRKFQGVDGACVRCQAWFGYQLASITMHRHNSFGNGFLLGLLVCNHSLANSLLHYELKCLDWVGVRRWMFQLEWVIFIFLMRMNCIFEYLLGIP